MLYGTVVRFFPEKGFGFIRADSGPDVFFHVSALGACQDTPTIESGQSVKYELETFSNRPQPATRDIPTRGASAAAQPRAKLVELIPRIPGGCLEQKEPARQAAHHPHARRKKPTWRR